MWNQIMRIARWLWVNLWHGHDRPPISTVEITLAGSVPVEYQREFTEVGSLPIQADSLL